MPAAPYKWTGRGPTIYAADFETITDADDCRVWAYGIASIDDPDNVTIGNSLIDFIRSLTKGNRTVYFHNLKFDGMFIIDWLLNHDYEWTDERFLSTMQFSTLYSDKGMLYSIRVKWSKNATTEFRDSLKKLPMSIEAIAASFKLPMKKGELDYKKFRPIGHDPDEDERAYIHNDVSILAHAMGKTIHSGMTKLTVGADSLDDYKKTVGKKFFAKNFPTLDPEIDDAIRLAYRGGYTYADPRWTGRKLTRTGVALDVNSLYPYVMRERVLPYGEPTRYEGNEGEGLRTLNVTFTAKLKPNHIPIIQVKKSFKFHESEYLTSIDEPTTLTVTNIDWELYNEHYDIVVHHYDGGYMFKGARGFFDSYIDKWMEIKRTTKGGERELAKLHLNSLYGKFATSCDVTGKYPVIDDDRVTWVTGDRELRDPVYTAMGAFITAYAREITIRAAQQNYDVFAYCDTDSLHLLQATIPETLTVDPTALGAWKHEYTFTEAFYMRAKAYMERTTEGALITRIAGLPRRVGDSLTFDDLYDGNVINGKLVPRTVPGGVVLVNSPYELKM